MFMQSDQQEKQQHPPTGEAIGAANELARGGPMALLTSREKTGSFERLEDRLSEGEAILIPRRQGGPFDPAGVRAQDVKSADNLVTLVEGHIGRWLMVTLTVDRRSWMSAEAAYQRCNERVREVARKVSKLGIHITAFEIQGKTGEGWPHWHLIVFAPDSRSLPEIREQVRKAWRIKSEDVDEETGEVRSCTFESIGITDVQEAKSREGIARYVAKYIVKPWAAVPAWMGWSCRQLRKYRFSTRCFDWLESRRLHVRQRGSRCNRHRRVKRRRRSLYERMASSESAHAAFSKVNGKLKWLGDVAVPNDRHGWDLIERVTSSQEWLCVGKRLAWRIEPRQVHDLRAAAKEGQLREAYMCERLMKLRHSWDEYQDNRSRDEGL